MKTAWQRTVKLSTVNSTVPVSKEINKACLFETKVWRIKTAFNV